MHFLVIRCVCKHRPLAISATAVLDCNGSRGATRVADSATKAPLPRTACDGAHLIKTRLSVSSVGRSVGLGAC